MKEEYTAWLRAKEDYKTKAAEASLVASKAKGEANDAAADKDLAVDKLVAAFKDKTLLVLKDGKYTIINANQESVRTHVVDEVLVLDEPKITGPSQLVELVKKLKQYVGHSDIAVVQALVKDLEAYTETESSLLAELLATWERIKNSNFTDRRIVEELAAFITKIHCFVENKVSEDRVYQPTTPLKNILDLFKKEHPLAAAQTNVAYFIDDLQHLANNDPAYCMLAEIVAKWDRNVGYITGASKIIKKAERLLAGASYVAPAINETLQELVKKLKKTYENDMPVMSRVKVLQAIESYANNDPAYGMLAELLHEWQIDRGKEWPECAEDFTSAVNPIFDKVKRILAGQDVPRINKFKDQVIKLLAANNDPQWFQDSVQELIELGFVELTPKIPAPTLQALATNLVAAWQGQLAGEMDQAIYAIRDYADDDPAMGLLGEVLDARNRGSHYKEVGENLVECIPQIRNLLKGQAPAPLGARMLLRKVLECRSMAGNAEGVAENLAKLVLPISQYLGGKRGPEDRIKVFLERVKDKVNPNHYRDLIDKAQELLDEM